MAKITHTVKGWRFIACSSRAVRVRAAARVGLGGELYSGEGREGLSHEGTKNTKAFESEREPHQQGQGRKMKDAPSRCEAHEQTTALMCHWIHALKDGVLQGFTTL
jgi:hypothetical protein